MKRTVFAMLASMVTTLAMTQSTIHLHIKNLPEYHPSGSNIYIAGSFNGWNPQDENYKFHHDVNGNYSIDLKIDNGTYEYKITRGGWDKAECKKGGQSMVTGF